jgi:hypothetical protein
LGFVQVRSAGEQALQDGTDTADFLNCFVRDMNDSLHKNLSGCRICRLRDCSGSINPSALGLKQLVNHRPIGSNNF